MYAVSIWHEIPDVPLKACLPIFKEHRIAAINWGFVTGKSQTNYPWESWTQTYTAEPELWFHDVFRSLDGTPYSKKEVEFIKTIILGSKNNSVRNWQDYKGWNSICLSNGIVELNIVPQIGGRIIQYKLADKEFFLGQPTIDWSIADSYRDSIRMAAG